MFEIAISVIKALEIIVRQFPINFKDLAGRPELYDKRETDKLIRASNRLKSADGTVWEPSISNDGDVEWKKVMADE
ncbi:hypothetical protein IV55_GL000726 [Furfurilactobacillus siliginis]|uniref:Uncharacterized protein n=1 Tax=Furfurilactobacillus siliginis TaxID=348151 RepID=A0A0R2LCV1_9LACO|nr:hypothetical protein IV55_GL000726 [Furfurilactobacillus siliginis]GEK28526.1 hypothetical protein LSI01_08370 [Furfurilactobacillus siliginis]